MKRQVCILPRTDERATGGVAAHIRALTRHLPAHGWEVTNQPGYDTLIHTHAIDKWPVLDVYTNHGIYPIKPTMPQWQQDANQAIFDNLKLARRVVVVSNWTFGQWANLTGHKLAPEGRVHIIYNGVDLDEWLDIPRGQWRARLQIPEGRTIVLWGKTALSDVLDPTPALELAIRRPDIALVMPLRPGTMPTAPKNVYLVGPQPYAAMQMLIADTDVYLATVCENHALQVVEAMAAGKPVLGYDWGGTR